MWKCLRPILPYDELQFKRQVGKGKLKTNPLRRANFKTETSKQHKFGSSKKKKSYEVNFNVFLSSGF